MKKISTGLLAIIIAVAGAAFTKPKALPAHPLTNNNYRYSLSTDVGDTEPGNYVFTTDLSGCNGSTVVCIISSPGPNTVGSHPSFPPGTDPEHNMLGVSVVSHKP